MKNTFVKVLSFLMALTMIVGTLGTVVVFAAEGCAHEDKTEIAVVPATCKTGGYTKYHCNTCGEEFIGGVTPKTNEHTLVDVPASKPTCTEDGHNAYKACPVCVDENGNYTYTEGYEKEGDATGHYWHKAVTVAATCTTDAYTSKECAYCQEIDDRVVTEAEKSDEKGWKVLGAKADHTYVYTVEIAPTACSTGTVIVTCSACNDYKVTIENKQDHDFRDIKTAGSDKEVADILKAKGYVYGTDCAADYKDGKICVDCGTLKDQVASAGTHRYVPVAEDKTNGKFLGNKVGASDLTQELEDLGFVVGSAISGGEKTCTSNGWYLGQCSVCGEYAKVPDMVNEGKGHKWGNWGATTPEDKPENHDVDKKQFRECANCDAVDEKVVKAATPHTTDWVDGDKKGEKVVYPTCTDNGYTIYTCKDCKKTWNDDVTYPTGHNYEGAEWSYVTGYVCGQATVTDMMVRYCQNVDRNDPDAPQCKEPDYKDAPANKTHNYQVTKVAEATCIANAVYKYMCADCKDEEAFPEGVTAPVSGFDSKNHVLKAADESKFVQKVADATCTTKQINRYMCSCGTPVDLKVGPTPTHLGDELNVLHTDDCKASGVKWKRVSNDSTSPDYNTWVLKDASKPCDAGCKLYFKHAATCQAAGVKKAGTFCSVCLQDITKPEIEPKNDQNHTAEGSSVGAVTNNATCQSAAYTVKYYSCCGGTKTVYEGAKNENVHVDFLGQAGKENSFLTFVAKVNPTCTTDGKEAHYVCSKCNAIVEAVRKDGAQGETKNDYTPAATNDKDKTVNKIDKISTEGHKFTVKVNAKAETCTDKGYVEYYTCPNTKNGYTCEYIKVGDWVGVPHDDSTTVDPTDTDDYYEEVEIAPHGDQYLGWHKGVQATCTTAGYTIMGGYDTVYACSVCHKVEVPATNHKNATRVKYENCRTITVTEGASTPDDGDDVYAASGIIDCTKPTYEVWKCPDCQYTYFRHFAKAVASAHTFSKYTSGDKKGQDKPDAEGTPTCTAAAQDTYECTVCDYSEKRAGAAAIGHKINVNGNIIPVDFSCNSADHVNYKGLICNNTNCGMELGEDYEHSMVNAPAKSATCTEMGYDAFSYCKNCTYSTEVVTHDALGHGKTNGSKLVETTATYKKYYCNDCSEYYTVEIPEDLVVNAAYSAKSVAAGQKIELVITASGKAIEYTSASVNISYDTNRFELVSATAGDAKAQAIVGDAGVAIIVPNNYNGEVQKAATTKEGTVIATVVLQAKKYANGAADTTVSVKFDNGNDIDAAAIPAVAVTGVGNLNGDALYTVDDALSLYNLVLAEDEEIGTEYDINGDGVANVADAVAIAKYSVSNKTVADFLKMIGQYDAIEAYAMELYETGAIADMDGDRAIMINDAYALINAVYAKLNGSMATVGFNYNNVEELVFAVMTAPRA